MITALIVANIALTIGLMSTIKQIKGINKTVEDINTNLAYIQKNGIEIGNNLVRCKNDLKHEFMTIHKNAIMYPSPLVFLKNKI